MTSHRNLDPDDIRYTHDTISENFGNGTPLEETFGELVSGEITVDDIETIVVTEKYGEYHVVKGNRRLFLFKKLREFNLISTVPVEMTPKFTRRNTSVTGGLSVEIRQDRSRPVGGWLDDRLNAMRYSQRWN